MGIRYPSGNISARNEDHSKNTIPKNIIDLESVYENKIVFIY